MTKENTSSPFFGAYNARHINPEEVAHQFVPSGKFWELIELRNSLLIGPRGSGKTHLLKMLQPKALAAWDGEEAERARKNIEYWGVFTPADINWKIQVDQKAESLGNGNEWRFTNAVFLSHFREAFINSILQITRDRPRVDFGGSSNKVEISKEDEVAFCIALADAWHLPLGIPSLDGLKVAIVEELAELGAAGSQNQLSPYIKRLLGMNLLGVAREISERFVAVTGLYSARWALCFDELEIAPQKIQEDLFQYLRSTDQRFLFKLAISPSNDASGLLNSEGAASAGNDYDAIPLWFIDQREREQFCLRLWEKHAVGTPAEHLPPYIILQRSRFQYSNQESSHGSRRYNSPSGWKSDFQELERKDPSFAEYLRRNGIRTAALDATSRDKMNSVVRKVAPLVGFRNAYLTVSRKESAGSSLVRKSLKRAPPDVFSGWEAICTATEGNPRWFSGIASRLLLRWRQSPSGKELTREQQAHELEISAKKFLAWINAIPIERAEDVVAQLCLYDLISTVAKYFEQSALGKGFTADPVLAFTVDQGTPEPIQKLVMAALNIGAIVIFNDEDINLTAASPVGKTFRLVHLLAPHFNLPMRRGKSRSLSSILSKQFGALHRYRAPLKAQDGRERPQQLGLFT
ncbi:ORC-CDC6 family AAA ATPase [Cupriavidus sp. 8B]